MNKKIGPSALFRAFYKQKEDCLFISYGRLEILGNHTDHNNGLCLVSTASMGIKAAIKKRDDKIISFFLLKNKKKYPKNKLKKATNKKILIIIKIIMKMRKMKMKKIIMIIMSNLIYQNIMLYL